MPKVTRIAFSADLNDRKLQLLAEQARLLGRVRSLVWRQFGSVHGVGVSDRQVRDRWMSDGTATTFGVLANPWKETVRDAVADIAAARATAKARVRRDIRRRTDDEDERRRLYTHLRHDRWMNDNWLHARMRKRWRRGRNRTHNQIIVRADQYKTFRLAAEGNVWLSIPGLERRRRVVIPLNTTVAPCGTLSLIIRGGRVEVHYQIEAAQMRSSQRP